MILTERYKPQDYEELTVAGEVVTPTRAKVDACDAAKLQFDGGQTNYRYDGGAPSVTVGLLTWDGREETMSKPELMNLALIRVTSLNATVHITYYKKH